MMNIKMKHSGKTGLRLLELAFIILYFCGGLFDVAGEEEGNPNKDKVDFGGYVEEVKYEKIDTVIKYKKELSPSEVEEIKKEASMDLLRDEENNITGIKSFSKESLQEFLKKDETPEMTKERIQEEALKEIMSESKGITGVKTLNNEPEEEEKQAAEAENDIPSDDQRTIEEDKDKGRSKRLVAITAISGTAAAAGALVAALLSNSEENSNDDGSGSLITDKPPLPPE